MRHLISYIKYCFTSGHQHGFGIHSPYLFHLVTRIIEEDLPYYKYSLIEKVRKLMSQVDERIGVFNDDGTKRLRKIKSVVGDYAITPKYGQLLFRLVNYYKPSVILEYGTTCGISTMYMAAPNSKTSVYSLSKQPEMADLSQSMCERIAMHNIKRSKATDLMAEAQRLVQEMPEDDFLYINSATPAEVSTLVNLRMARNGKRFFIVVPNPYTTDEMWNVWQALKADERVKLSINIFNLGILIANENLQKEDFILRF